MSDTIRDQCEKDIRERWFPRHVAEYSVLTDGTNEIERLRWHQPGTSVYYCEYWYRNGTLHVHGDIGEAVYRWYGDIGKLHDLAQLDSGYFASKCCASESGRGYKTWDSEVARDNLKDRFEYYPEEKAVFGENDGEESLYSRGELLEWLRDYGDECFGSDWIELVSIGEVVDCRCHAHLIGLKMAFAQLKAAEVAA